jgi:hypothetical protein
MALSSPAPFRPPLDSPAGPPPSDVATTPPRTDASPSSQLLAYGALAVAFAALGVRAGDPLVFGAPAGALALGIAVCIGTDVRRFLRTFPGVVAAMLAMLVLTLVWMVVESRGTSFPYPAVLLVGIAVLGTDWAWVERIRPLVVVSGLSVAVLLDTELATALLVALGWFATAATALWSLQRDTRRSLPTPSPIGGRRRPVDPTGQELAMIAGSSIALALVATLLISMIHIELDPPAASDRSAGRSLPGSSGASPSGGRSSGGGAGSRSGSGSPSGPGSGSEQAPGAPGAPGSGGGVLGQARDRDGDGVIDHGDGISVLDRNGDGVIDQRDSADPVDGNGDGVIDGRDGYVFLDANDDGVIDELDAGGEGDLDRRSPPDVDGDGVIDRNDVPILSDTNDDGIIDRRDVVIVTDIDGSGSIDAGDVDQAADRNGDGVVDARDDLDIIDANGDGAVDDEELLDTLDRDGDGTIDRDEALVIDRNGDGRLDPSEIGELPLSGEEGRQLEDRRREMATEDVTRTLLIALGALLLLAAAVVAAVLVHRRLSRRSARAERAWALVLVERLEAEGAERGRPRRHDEPISHYAAALGDGALADPRLGEVGLVLTAALFAPTPPDESAGAWAAQVVSDAVAANPVPTRSDERRDRRDERRRRRSGDVPVGS